MVAVGLVATVAAVRASQASLGPGAPLALDLAAVAAAVLLYLAVVRPRTAGPLQTLAVPLAFGLGVLAMTAIAAASHQGTLDPKTAMPSDPATALWTGILGGAELGLAVVVLASLRPLALHRRRQPTAVAWGVLLGLSVVAALLVAGHPITSLAPPLLVLPVVGTVGAAAGLALRQRWIGALTSGQRLAAAGLALGLAATLTALVYAQMDGPALLLIGDGTGEVRAVPHVMALSRSLSVLVLLSLAFGGLYALAAGLTLLLGPSADTQVQRAGERRALQSLADLSGRLLDRSALAAAVARGPVEAGLGAAAWVALTDPAHGRITPEVVAAEGIPIETAAQAADADALYRAAVDHKGPLVLTHAEADHRVHARPGDGIASLVVLPLGGPDARGSGRLTRGVLLVARGTAEPFDPDDLAALDTFAGQAALSLSHADLFADALERERLARELTLAREVQQRLLPQSLPRIDGVEIAAAERPAREVGGDYYDAVRLGDDCVGVIVADVSGKGAPAAFYMAEMKGVFQAASRLTRSPGELLAGANDALAPSLARGVFVSAAYAVLDADAGTLALARAGHTPAVLVRDRDRADGGRWLLRGGGLAIGLDRGGTLFRQSLCEQTLQLAPGDTLLLYTDGLVEARDGGGTEYGYDRLAAFVEAHAHEGALDLRDRLLAEHRAWSGSDEPDDDTTFVVIRWAGRGESVAAVDVSAGPPVSERPAFSSP